MAARSSPDWLIYALGGGWGHLTRAAALARVASERHAVRILTNSPYVAHVRGAMPDLDLAIVDPALPVEDARREAVRQVQRARPRCLIVDTFPRGLAGELAGVLSSIAAVKVLVHRGLSPRYVREFGLRRFVKSVYDVVLIPGEDEGGAFDGVTTPPWLIRDPSESSGEGCILVCASGPAEELAWYGAVVVQLLAHHRRSPIRCIAPICPPGCPLECWTAHWPAVDLYASASVVIGSAGYNTIHECLAWGIPLIARPWPRQYDRQWLRARRAARRGRITIVERPEEAASAALRELSAARPSRRVEFQNGVKEASMLIERAIP